MIFSKLLRMICLLFWLLLFYQLLLIWEIAWINFKLEMLFFQEIVLIITHTQNEASLMISCTIIFTTRFMYIPRIKGIRGEI